MPEQALMSAGVDENSLDNVLAEQLEDVERLHETDDGINSVLLLSAIAELGQLKEQASVLPVATSGWG